MTDFLLNTSLFQGISARQIHNILAHFQLLRIRKNHLLFDTDKKARYFFIVVTGQFSIEMRSQAGKLQFLGYARSGDILGETALLSNSAHSGRVSAVLDSEVYRINRKDFETLLFKYPQLAVNLGQIEATRLRQRISNPREQMYTTRFIAHFSASYPETHHPVGQYIGLNLAMAMGEALEKQVAYLSFASGEKTVSDILQLRVSSHKAGRICRELQNLRRFNVKECLVRYERLSLLAPGDAHPADFLKPADLPRLLGKIALVHPVIFMDLGDNLDHPLVKAAVRQADLILCGLSQSADSLNQLKSALDKLRKSQNADNMNSRLYIYLNNMELLDHRKEKNQKERFLHSQIEQKLSHPVDFQLRGNVATAPDLIRNGLLVKSRSNQAATSMRSLGRWLVNRRVGIAFGGGGARALAEIGVYRELEKLGVHFDAITGTSMGALIGALVAMGISSAEIERRFAEFLPDDSVFADYSLPIISFFRGRKMNKLLRKTFGNTRFEDLPIPFTCVAVDLLTGKEVHLNRGFLWRAIRASMSLPVIFPPVKYRGMYLIDGGALNVVPGNILRQNRVHVVLGINCTPLEDNSLASYIRQTDLFRLLNPDRHFLKNLNKLFALLALMIRRPPILQIANRSMMLEGAELIKSKAHNFDLLFTPDVAAFGLFDFQKLPELIASGEAEVRRRIPQLKNLLTEI